MKIWVTGAGGMVGSHLVEILHDEGHDVFGTYFTPTTDVSEINPKIKLEEVDVRNKERMYQIIDEFRPLQIYHLAAQSYPSVSWVKPYETMDINAGGTIAIFEGIKLVKAKDPSYDPVVVVACSSAEYGQTMNELKPGEYPTEDYPLRPLHPYGVSKVCQDLLSYQYFMNFGIKTIRCRIFNTTGSKKEHDITADFTRRVVKLEKAGNVSNKLTVGNLDTNRAILDVRDLINAMRLLAQKGHYGDVYNISGEEIFPMIHVVECIEKIMGVKYELVTDPALLRPADEKIYAGRNDKLKKDTGWKQMYKYEDTVKDEIEYWRKKLK